MVNKIVSFLTLSMISSGCFKNPLVSKGTVDNGRVSLQAVSYAAGATKEIATVTADSKVDVNLTTPKVTGLKGARVTVVPGTLGISVDLVVEQASDLGETSISNEIGLASDVQVSAASPGMIIRPSEKVDLKKTLTLAMPLPSLFGLRLDTSSSSKYAILYKSFDPIQQKLLTGIKLVDGKDVKISYDESSGLDVINFQGYFGAYWAVILNREVTQTEVPLPQPASEPILNKAKISVITTAGFVKEVEIVQQELVPELIWAKPSISFDSLRRIVTLIAPVPAGHKVDSCKVDFFQAATLQSGISLEAPFGTSVEYFDNNFREHSLVGRFRCVDEKSRVTVTPWSDSLIIPGNGDPNYAGDDVCAEVNPARLHFSGYDNAGQNVYWNDFPNVGKCKYSAKLFLDAGQKIYIQNNFQSMTCGLSNHSVTQGENSISCKKTTFAGVGNDYMSIPAGNYSISLDFTASKTDPKMTFNLIPCDKGDLYLNFTASQSGTGFSTPTEKMTHRGACEYVWDRSDLPLTTGSVRIQNLNASYVCGQSGMELNEGLYAQNSCSSAPDGSQYFKITTAIPATMHHFKLRLGESLNNMYQSNPTSDNSFEYKVDSLCPDQIYMASAARGEIVEQFRNYAGRYGLCSYSFNITATDPDPSRYNYKLRTLDNGLVCGQVAPGDTQITCAGSPALIELNAELDRSYNILIKGNPSTGKLTDITTTLTSTYCDALYLQSSIGSGMRATQASALHEVRDCVFEKVWIPTAANPGFYLSQGDRQTCHADISPTSQPTVGGSAPLYCYNNLNTNSSTAIKPIGSQIGVAYKLTVDMRESQTIKVEALGTEAVCADDLHMLGSIASNPTQIDPSNKFTYLGNCNYSYTVRNDSAMAVDLEYFITDANQSFECAQTGSSPSPTNSVRSFATNCVSAPSMPTLYTLNVQAQTSLRLYVKRAGGGGRPTRLTLQNLKPYWQTTLSGALAQGLSNSQRLFVEPMTTGNMTNNFTKQISVTAAGGSFLIGNQNWNMICGKDPSASPGLAPGTDIPVLCGYASEEFATPFGGLPVGDFRIYFKPQTSFEDIAMIQVNAL